MDFKVGVTILEAVGMNGSLPKYRSVAVASLRIYLKNLWARPGNRGKIDSQSRPD